MGKLGKILGILFAIVVLIVVGLSLTIKFYLTDERVKNIIVPKAEEALGRQVNIGKIKVGLFSGIVIENFVIKESDNQSDFLSTESFILSYDLLALLQKKVDVSELRIENPIIRISRDQKGIFNYSDLAILAKTPETEQQKASSGKQALPVALTVRKIAVKNAQFILHDAKKELPDVDASADLDVSLSFDSEMQSIYYNGNLSLEGNVIYGEAKPIISGSVDFSQESISLEIDLTLDQEDLHFSGQITDFLASPDVAVDITSNQVNLDNLLALAASLPSSENKTETNKKTPHKSAQPIARKLPDGMVANGKVAIQKAIYKGVDINAFILQYNLQKGILSIKELGAVTLGGSVISNLRIDLNEVDPSFSGSLSLSSIKAAQLQSAFAKKAANIVSGSLESSIEFAGKGSKWDSIKNSLTADGDFALKHGTIPETPTTVAVSKVLGIRELRSLSYRDISGKFNITKGGKVKVNSSLSAPHIDIKTDGQVGLDGSMDLPLTVTLDDTLSNRMGGSAAVSQFLSDDEGNTVVNIKLGGTTDNPYPTLDGKSVGNRIGGKILNNLRGRTSGGTRGGSSGKSLFDGFFK